MPESSASVCVVLPTYNEAGNLERMVGALRALAVSPAVVVVDDASPDGTGIVADRLAASDSRVHVVHRHGQRGLGGAYAAGFREALAHGCGAVATMDCDFSHDPARLPALLAGLQDADLAVGSRYVAGGRILNWSIDRRALSWSANTFVRALFRLPVHDCTSGFRAYRRALLEAIPWERIYSNGYAFLVEALVWAALIEEARVVEVPIDFHERTAGHSKLGLHEALQGLRQLPRLRLDLARRTHSARIGAR